ncbi:MAG: hormogonium polysaccharide secretion pseudopilin HpsB [Rivularia sp. (in: cyanobacteria)]
MLKRKLRHVPFKNNQTGFTIIESLVAVIVLGILMTAIAPTIVLSTATRIQSRRIELATQAARAYIDGVSTGNIPAPPVTNIEKVKAPRVSLVCRKNDLEKDKGYCSSPKESSYRVFCVDGDADNECSKDNPKDMIVQAFGFNSSSDEASRGYKMNIRVYRADAFKDSEALETNDTNKNKDKKATQSTFSGGIGNRKAPLVEMTTEIGTSRTSFEDFCSRLEVYQGRVKNGNLNSKCK